MKLIVQRVKEVYIKTEGKIHDNCGRGLLVLVGISKNDDGTEISFLADKLVNLRIFEDEHGKMNLSVKDIKGDIAAVSQFTVYGDTKKGRRPGFSLSDVPEKAKPLYDKFIEELKYTGLKVIEGVFGSHMHIGLINDGPATFIIEKDNNNLT